MGGEHIAMEFRQEGIVEKRTGAPHECFRTNGCEICNLTFTKNLSNLTIYIQMENKITLSYLLKIRIICHYNGPPCIQVVPSTSTIYSRETISK